MKEHWKKFKAFYIFCIGIIFNFCESIYFGMGSDIGFNLIPQSIPELICDIISVIIMFFAFCLIVIDGKSVNNTYTVSIDYNSDYGKEVLKCLDKTLSEQIESKDKKKVKNKDE
jgi:hypothetical protein